MAEGERRAIERASKQLFIDGEWRPAAEGGSLEVQDPSTGELLCEVADATPEDAVAALDAAFVAQAEWAATAPITRSEILQRAFESLREQSDELALLLTLEMGKALPEAKAEIAYAAEFFRWFAGEALRVDGLYKVAGTGRSRVLVMRQPVGPCYFITPWNFPIAMGARKLAPALAAGCTSVIKPAHQTPLSMLALA
ncbi:MAG: aldehyde dehydrogenase family protein, partial [bacterium]